MKTGPDNARFAAQEFDLRVRDRHLASGVLEPNAVEQHLAELPDLEAQAETIPIEQPALGGSDMGNPASGPA